MTNTVSVTMSTLVDRTLEQVQTFTELGKTVVRTNALTASETTFLLTGFTAAVSDVLEFGTELMLVTAKSSAVDPVYTVSRGYYGTTAAAHDALEVGRLNPQWNRKRVATAIQDAFRALEAFDVIVLTTTVVTPTESAEDQNRFVLAVPADAREVRIVRNDLVELTGWEFLEELPTADYPTGKVIRLPRWIDTTHDFAVVYRGPYRWSTYPDTPDEDATITVPEGADSLPCAYAAAWLLSSREISRQELDRGQEYSTTEPVRGGISAALVRSMWAEFYRKLDEVRRMDPAPTRRPFVRRPWKGFV